MNPPRVYMWYTLKISIFNGIEYSVGYNFKFEKSCSSNLMKQTLFKVSFLNHLLEMCFQKHVGHLSLLLRFFTFPFPSLLVNTFFLYFHPSCSPPCYFQCSFSSSYFSLNILFQNLKFPYNNKSSCE